MKSLNFVFAFSSMFFKGCEGKNFFAGFRAAAEMFGLGWDWAVGGREQSRLDNRATQTNRA